MSGMGKSQLTAVATSARQPITRSQRVRPPNPARAKYEVSCGIEEAVVLVAIGAICEVDEPRSLSDRVTFGLMTLIPRTAGHNPVIMGLRGPMEPGWAKAS